ncbi:MAG: class I tRNA ligase family protein, partial [Actinobacteria bacterium]|nr:class I tRNA ligase family protein [Actinomycetota bacterium]
PFHRLFNQGYIQAFAYRDPRGQPVTSTDVEERDGTYWYAGEEVQREYGKMGKSLKNIVTPDEMYDEYGADTFRLYEMSSGPLEASRPWNTRDVIGMQRFLQRVWRNMVDEDTGASRVVDTPATPELRKLLHRMIEGIRSDMDGLRFNTAIAKLIELNNALTQEAAATGSTPLEIASPMIHMLAPLCPHMAEELWGRLGHSQTLTFEPFPVFDPQLLIDDTFEYPVQINGKVRSRLVVPTGTDLATVQALVLSDPKVLAALGGQTPKKVVVVPGRMVNLVL